MSSQYGELQPTNSWDRFWEFGAPQQISTSFAPWCHYCTDVAHRRPTKLCTMFGHLLGSYTIQALSGALGPWRNSATCKIHFAFKACILLYWLQQCASAKLCGHGTRNGITELLQRAPPIFSAGRPSRWASAHISSCYSNAGQKCQRSADTWSW